MGNSSRATVSIVDRDHITINSNGQTTTLEGRKNGLDDEPHTDILIYHVIQALAQASDLAFKNINYAFLHLIRSSGHAVSKSKEATEETSYGEQEADNAKGSIEVWHRFLSLIIDLIPIKGK